MGPVGLKDLQQRWEDDAVIDDKRRRDGSLSIQHHLSIPAGTDAVAVKKFGAGVCDRNLRANHGYVFVQHLDDKHPRPSDRSSLGHDGRRLNHVRQTFRPGANGCRRLRLRGIAAEATTTNPGTIQPTAGRCACASEIAPRSIGWRGRRFCAR